MQKVVHTRNKSLELVTIFLNMGLHGREVEKLDHAK